jgi:LacI family transcriptional regulator
MESGYDLVMGVRGFLREYDGIIALNDLMAIGAILAIREIGLRIPEDIAVLGYDDTDLASCMRPTLTTIHQPREELSLVTCERLLELVQTSHAGRNSRSGRMPRPARRIVLTPKLVIRETTGG